MQRTLVCYSNHDKGQCEFTINSTKTVTSTRDLPLTDELKELFQMQRERGIECQQTVDGVTDFVFTNRFGGAQHQGTVNKAIRRIVRAANSDQDAVALPQFSCHVLRHTYCTNLIMAGVELTAASALLGHTDIRTTANIYADVMQESKDKAMRQMTEYVTRGNGENNGEK